MEANLDSINQEKVVAMDKALKAFFDPQEVYFLPMGRAYGGRCMAAAYITARHVMDRLDEVFGADGWKAKYTMLSPDSCLCELSVRFPSGWVTREDVGGASEQQDPGDRTKAAFSDALKRAAVQFGIFRYGYSLGRVYAEFDEQSKRFTERGDQELRGKLLDYMRRNGWEGDVPASQPQNAPAGEFPVKPKANSTFANVPMSSSMVAKIREKLADSKKHDEVKILAAYSKKRGTNFTRLEELTDGDGRAILDRLEKE